MNDQDFEKDQSCDYTPGCSGKMSELFLFEWFQNYYKNMVPSERAQ